MENSGGFTVFGIIPVYEWLLSEDQLFTGTPVLHHLNGSRSVGKDGDPDVSIEY
jgi:hypothetical protein